MKTSACASSALRRLCVSVRAGEECKREGPIINGRLEWPSTRPPAGGRDEKTRAIRTHSKRDDREHLSLFEAAVRAAAVGRERESAGRCGVA